MRQAHSQLDAYTPARDQVIDKFKRDLRAMPVYDCCESYCSEQTLTRGQ